MMVDNMARLKMEQKEKEVVKKDEKSVSELFFSGNIISKKLIKMKCT